MAPPQPSTKRIQVNGDLKLPAWSSNFRPMTSRSSSRGDVNKKGNNSPAGRPTVASADERPERLQVTASSQSLRDRRDLRWCKLNIPSRRFV